MKLHYVLPRLVYRSVIALNTIALSAPSFALGLPTLENPSRGTGSGIMETIRNYGYDIVPLASLLSTVALVPTCIVAAIALGGFVGGGILRRQKRGRPDTWLYRHLQWWLARLPQGRLRLPPQYRRAAPARARHLRDSRPRLRRQPQLYRGSLAFYLRGRDEAELDSRGC